MPEAVTLLAERVEGNLLAAAQEIEKLALLADDRELTAQAVLAAVGDSARYSIYDFVDAALLGQPERVARILDGLRDEGIEPVLVNWALHQESRRLAMLAFARSQGQPLEAVFAALAARRNRLGQTQAVPAPASVATADADRLPAAAARLRPHRPDHQGRGNRLAVECPAGERIAAGRPGTAARRSLKPLPGVQLASAIR